MNIITQISQQCAVTCPPKCFINFHAFQTEKKQQTLQCVPLPFINGGKGVACQSQSHICC